MASCDQLQETAYSSFNKVKQIIEGVQELDILYGPDYEHCKESFSDQTFLTKTRYFFHGNYEVEYDNDGIRKLHYIYTGDGVVALYEERKTTAAMYYIHKDHLGSWQVITDQQGDVVQEQSFDAWGRRRNPTDWTYDNVNSDPRFHRGYTKDEQLDQFCLINMNGRMYDPVPSHDPLQGRALPRHFLLKSIISLNSS